MIFDYKPIGFGATVYSGFAFKSSDLKNEGIPVIKIGNIQNKIIDYSSTQFFSEEKITDKHNKFFLEDKDVLIAMTGQGSVGRVGRIRLPSGKKILLNQRVGKFVTDNTKLDNDFLFYVISSSQYEEILFNAGSGSGQPNLSPKTILSVEIPYPSIHEQKAIADTLSCLDDKIELNNRINTNLEEIAQAIFKRWFIDFEFPDENGDPYKSSGGKMVETEFGLVPEGWHNVIFSNLVNKINKRISTAEKNKYLHYTPIDKLPKNKLTFYSSNDISEAKSSLIAYKENDILLGAMRVYFHRVSLAPYDGITRTTTLVFRPKGNYLLYYCLLTVNSDSFITFADQTSKGSTIPYATWENGIENYPLLQPPEEILETFNDVVNGIFQYSKLIIKSNKYLDDLRNELLPKLLSGEIKLPTEEGDDNE